MCVKVCKFNIPIPKNHTCEICDKVFRYPKWQSHKKQIQHLMSRCRNESITWNIMAKKMGLTLTL